MRRIDTAPQAVRRGGLSDIAFADVANVRRLLERREVSALELARYALDALDGTGRALGAVAELTPEVAERQARAADIALRRGSAGPLCGVPYGAKDLLDTAGVPTRWGSRVYRSRVPDRDATAVQRMRRGGAVLVAKLALVELAGAGGYRRTAASATGACRNPWDPDRWAGGSSSGSAAAVAAGLLPITLGSETGGSLILPASFCGVTTIRPSFGAVSRYGAMPVAWSMDKIGPLARSARDCALILAVIAGADEMDPSTWDLRLTRARRGPLRLGVIRDAVSGATSGPFSEALAVLGRLGVRIKEVTLPAHDYLATYFRLMDGEIADAHRDLIASGDLDSVVDPAQREGLRRAAGLSAADLARALRDRALMTRDVRALFRDLDALVAPTVLIEAMPLEADVIDTRRERGGHAFLGALAGLPAVSVPMGIGPAGLPVGLAFTGDLGSDATILRLAALYQRATDWHTRRPSPVHAAAPRV